MGIVLSVAWIALCIVYATHFIMRLNLSWLIDDHDVFDQICNFLFMAVIWLIYPALVHFWVEDFDGNIVRSIWLYVPLALLAVDLGTWFKPSLAAAWLLGTEKKSGLLPMFIRADRPRARAIRRLRRPWRKYAIRSILIMAQMGFVAMGLEWLLTN